MKGKKLIITIGIICLVLISGVLLFNKRYLMVSLENHVGSKATNSSEATFRMKKNDELKVKYKSTVKEGELKINLIDPKGNVVEDFDTNVNLSKQISLNEEGQYTLSVDYSNFIGSYVVDVNKK